jgi:bifunctional DNase/RNase
MKEMFVNQVGVSTSGQPVVLLSDNNNEKALPIYIGAGEAASISMALLKRKPPRPLSHDLFMEVIESLGSHVDKLEIVSITDDAYFAKLCMTTASGETTETDCRPSDGIAIALRANAPILVAPEVIAKALVDVVQEHKKEPRRIERDAQFSEFIDNVKPADFVLPHLKADIEQLEDLLDCDPLQGERADSGEDEGEDSAA